MELEDDIKLVRGTVFFFHLISKKAGAPGNWPAFWLTYQRLGRALEGEGRGSARLVAFEGDNQGRQLWRILAGAGIVEARKA